MGRNGTPLRSCLTTSDGTLLPVLERLEPALNTPKQTMFGLVVKNHTFIDGNK